MTRIALLTDFGTRDPYVAAMKGVITARTDVPVFDLTHEIAPFDVFGAAWYLRDVVAWWPHATIIVAVVDPGVGTDRRILGAEQGAIRYLAPDNGLLSFVLEENATVVSIEDQSLFLPDGSTTFHGRDRFAPVAAALAGGADLTALGPRASEWRRLDYAPPEYDPDTARGTVVAVDRFGNCITDLEYAHIGFFPMEVSIRNITTSRLATTYADGGEGIFVIVGSSGCLEISVSNGDAAALLHVRRGERVEVRAIP